MLNPSVAVVHKYSGVHAVKSGLPLQQVGQVISLRGRANIEKAGQTALVE
jgi:hypothetical protein